MNDVSPDPLTPEGRLLRIAAEMVRLTAECETGHKRGTPHVHSEVFHSYGRAVASEVNALRSAPNRDETGLLLRETLLRIYDLSLEGMSTRLDIRQAARLALAATEASPTPHQALLNALWACGVASGMDTDGDSGPGAMVAGMGEAGFAAAMVAEVQRLQADYRAALDATEPSPTLDVERLAEAIFMAGTDDSAAVRIGNDSFGAVQSRRFAREVAVEYERLTPSRKVAP